MIKLVWDNSFKRSYKKRISNNDLTKKKFWDALYLFEKNPFDTKLKTHKLSGKLMGSWAFSITYNYRVVFRFYDNQKTVLLIDIGSHDEIY